MTTIPRLGRRQVAVLRAAATGTLIRFDDDTWAADGHGCTQPARRVAELGLLTDGKNGAIVTGGSWKTRPGVWMGLSVEGQAALDAWDLANPEKVTPDMTRAEDIRALAGLTGDALVAGVRDLAAAELGVDSGAFKALSQAMRGETPTTETRSQP